MGVARDSKPGTIVAMSESFAENCLHLEGLHGVPGAGFRCFACDEWLDMEGVKQWVRTAEEARDKSYPLVEGDEFGAMALGERQREVYRRRKIMYELQNVSRIPIKPEMILIVHDDSEESYRCRIFYKEPRPASGIERLDIGVEQEDIAGFRSHRDPIVRLVAEKVDEFHTLRLKLSDMGEPAPARRVFYSNDL